MSGAITSIRAIRRASEDEPQYEIASDKIDHVTAHKGSALRKLGGGQSPAWCR